MNVELSLAEKQFLKEVLEELKHYQVSPKMIKEVKQQLFEHIQESREHGQDSITELGDSTTLVKEFLEMNEVDLHSKIKQIKKTKKKTGTILIIGFTTLIVTYLISQLVLSMFLTESFNPLNTNHSFHYNIFYKISDNSWWNSLLVITSGVTSLTIALCVSYFLQKK
jgi:hypothetical protein